MSRSFGHLELARPVYYYHFLDIVVKILKCVCFKCGKLLLDVDNPIVANIIKKDKKARWKEIYELISNSKNRGRCENEDGCGCKQPDRYKTDGISGIQVIWKERKFIKLKENIDYFFLEEGKQKTCH